jgi:phosphohistidine swiveling domain-containing protein
LNTVRKLLENNMDEIKAVLERAYYAIESFQNSRQDKESEKNMNKKILEATEVLQEFKPYIPAYKQKYFDIVDNYEELKLSSRDLIMAFDRMVYELHTRLEKRLSEDEKLQAWSPLMLEILDGRRTVPEKEKKVADEVSLDFVASGLVANGGYVKSNIRIVESTQDLEKVKGGDILISKMTTPDIIMVINKISGIVTEEGGRVCHASVIAREYNIPCVVGCGEFITSVEENEIMILDAWNGILFRESKS